MKKRAKHILNEIRVFIEYHWSDILLVLVSSFVGGVLYSLFDKQKTKTFTFCEAYDNPETIDDFIVDNTAGWKVQMDVKGNKAINASVCIDYFDKHNDVVSGHILTSF